MKKLRENIVWIAGLVLAVVVLAVVCLFIIGFFGNPVSHLLASRTARQYQAAHYPTYTIEASGYNFKTGRYYAHLTDPPSPTGIFRWNCPPAASCCWIPMQIGYCPAKTPVTASPWNTVTCASRCWRPNRPVCRWTSASAIWRSGAERRWATTTAPTMRW